MADRVRIVNRSRSVSRRGIYSEITAICSFDGLVSVALIMYPRCCPVMDTVVIGAGTD